MNSTDLAKELQTLEQQRDSLAGKMDQLYVTIQEAMPDEAAAWMDREIDRRITENTEHVQSLGPKLSEMKKKLTSLKKKLPELVSAEFKNKADWPHQQHTTKTRVYSGADDRQVESHSHRAFRNVISSLGSLLNEFGLLKSEHRQYSSWEKTGEKTFRYSINPGYGMYPNESPNLKAYFELLKQYSELDRRIELTRTDLSQAKAKELWNKA